MYTIFQDAIACALKKECDGGVIHAELVVKNIDVERSGANRR
jgi:hypothetical protein